MNQSQAKKSEQILRLYPWYSGLSQGTLFYTAISTLFFTVVKGLSASQIVMMETIATLSCILLQRIILKTIKKIGNTKSIILGSFILTLSVILATIGNYHLLIISCILELVAYTFKNMENIILKNNLNFLNKSTEYMKYKNKAFLVYSIATAIIALIASKLFILNHYLPMFFCILFCVITFIMSFFVQDITLEKENNEQKKQIPITDNSKSLPTSTIVKVIILFGIIRTCIALGFNNTQLFIQYDLQEYFNLEQTAYYLGIIIFASRIVRIISNLSFNHIHNLLKDKLMYLIPVLLLMSYLLLVFSHLKINHLLLKFVGMGTSYGIILYIIDSFTAVIQDVLLTKCSENKHQSILTYLTFSYNLFKTIFGFVVSLILLKHELIYVFGFLIILILIGIINMRIMYEKINKYFNKSITKN